LFRKVSTFYTPGSEGSQEKRKNEEIARDWPT
jgi:hypothetical protein